MDNGKKRLRRARQSGFTYLAVLLMAAVMGAMLAAVSTIWSHSRQREKESELLWIGTQFRQAIGLYYERTPGAAKDYPQKLEDLLEDKRFPMPQRYLRRIYVDPITGKRDWGLVTAADGRIMGVYSKSQARPIKASGFGGLDEAFEQAGRHADWQFVYRPPSTATRASEPSTQELSSAPAR